jgi:hypothetical protein
MKTYKRKNTIPRPLAAVITLARNAHAGGLKSGGAAARAYNTPEKIGRDLHDVIGNPATPLVPGKQAQYAAQLVAVKAAYVEKVAAIRAGREFCRRAVSLLRLFLGNDWNTAWQAAGFHLPSLALPAHPAAMLTGLRAYFGADPARENVQAGVTAAAAETAAARIDAALLAVASAKRTLVSLKAQRDRALKTLRQRLSGLRAELELLLEDDSGLWYEFGFKRPADGRKPLPVEEVNVTVAAPGVVVVKWGSAPLAEDYRVTWKPRDGSSLPGSDGGAERSAQRNTEAGLLSGTQAILRDLPAGVPIIIGVSARNSHGETKPTEREIVV